MHIKKCFDGFTSESDVNLNIRFSFSEWYDISVYYKSKIKWNLNQRQQ